MIGALAPDSGSGWQVIQVLILLTSWGVSIVALVRTGRPQKTEVMNPTQKREVVFGPEVVTKDVCTQQHVSLIARVETLELAEEQEDDRRRQLYINIDNVRKELKADIERVEDKVEVMPTTVINLLRQTGVIK